MLGAAVLSAVYHIITVGGIEVSGAALSMLSAAKLHARLEVLSRS